MATYRRRVNSSSGQGAGSQTGSGTGILGDNNDGTYLKLSRAFLFTPYGTVSSTFPTFTTGTHIPAGRKVIAIRPGHRIKQVYTSDDFPYTYLRDASGAGIGVGLYMTDPKYSSWRDQVGESIYKSGTVPWTDAELNGMTIFTRWWTGDDTYVSEEWMDVVYDEPLPTPSSPYPAASSTVNTSTVAFSVVAPAPQAEQPLRLVVQVARDTGFTNSLKTFYSGYSNATAAGSRVTYTTGDSDLGPGLWYRRYKIQDIMGTETAYSATDSFTVTHDPLPTPVNTTPAPGSITINPYAIRSTRFDVAATDNRKVGAEWQFSKVSNFASGVVTWKNITSGVTGTGTVLYDPLPDASVGTGLYGSKVGTGDPSQYLSQGVWYVRSRAVDKWSQTGPWSSTDSFTVQHQPLAQNVTPASDQVIDQTVTPARWTFGDPWTGDAQTAYRVRAYTEAGTLVYDGTKLTSTAIQHIMAIPIGNLYARLRLTVEVWDKDDVTSTQIASYWFYFSNSPAITMSVPTAGQQVATGQPTFQWNPGIGRPGTTQRSYELKVYNTATANLIYTSGVQTSTATSHTPPQTILRNGNSYQLTLRIVDSDGLTSTLTRNFSAVYVAPADVPIVVDAPGYSDNGFVRITWASAVPDNYFIEWRIYRREEGTTDWILVDTLDDSAAREYHDWTVPKVANFQWTVTQVADRFGFVLESGLAETAPAYFTACDDFWLIDPLNEAYNLRLYHVVDAPWTSEYERNSYVVKNRGKRTNFGTKIGKNGTMTCRIRPKSGYSPTQLIDMLEAMAERRHAVILRDPFGRSTQISLGDLSNTPEAGMGVYEFGDVEIPWEQVF